MNAEESTLLRQLLLTQPVAALATLHRGDPAVSMVPFAWHVQDHSVIVHVSQLATHTQDMCAHDAVSLLVTGTLSQADTPLALPRVSITGHAQKVDPASAVYASARDAYLSKHPNAQPLFDFADFSLFRVCPQHLRFVAGFGLAMTVMPNQFEELMQTKA